MAKPTVLIVEDEPALRELLSRVLIIAGYSTLVADRGEDALALVTAADSVPSVLVADIVLPGMNGHDLAKEVVCLHPRTRVGFITGWFDPDSVPLGMCQSCWCLLRKPFSISELLSFVESITSEPTCQRLLYGNNHNSPSAAQSRDSTTTRLRRNPDSEPAGFDD